MLEKKVLETIKKYNLIDNGDRLVLGVSGGPDSMTMLNILNSIKSKKIIDFNIVVAHINHGLRENAKLDEEYVLNYCQKQNIDCFVLHTNIKETAEMEKRGLEETGRKVRYNYFDEILEKTNSNKVSIAHNLNDNVETIIMNIIRGSGLTGLKGIEPCNNKYIRPLIEIKREEIEEYCFKNKLNPRYDETNEDNIYTRNKIRNVVIPYVKKELNPNIIETIRRLSLIVKDDIDFLDIQTQNAYNNMCLKEENIDEITEIKADRDFFKTQKNLKEKINEKPNQAIIVLDLKKFNKENKAIQKRVILYAITKLFGSAQGIERIHVEDMIKLCNNNIGNKYLTPNKNFKIVIKNKNIYFEKLK